MDQKIQRDGAFAARAGLKRQYVAQCAVEGVAAADVVPKEVRQYVRLGGRHAALVHLEFVPNEKARLKARRGKAVFAQSDDAGQRLHRIHAPAAAVAAQDAGRFHQAEASIGVADAQLFRFLEQFADALAYRLCRFLEDRDVAQMLRAHQQLDFHARHFNGLALKGRRQQGNFGHRRRGAKAKGVCFSVFALSASRPRDQPALGHIHEQIDIEIVAPVSLRVFAARCGTGRWQPMYPGHQRDIVLRVDGRLAAHQDELGVLSR